MLFGIPPYPTHTGFASSKGGFYILFSDGSIERFDTVFEREARLTEANQQVNEAVEKNAIAFVDKIT